MGLSEEKSSLELMKSKSLELYVPQLETYLLSRDSIMRLAKHLMTQFGCLEVCEMLGEEKCS